MTSKVAFHTLGCKLNYAETSTIGKKFNNEGYDIVDFADTADVYVINTCTVTESADRECRQIVRRALRKNPNAFIIVIGCYAQLRSEELAKIEGVDLILGSKEKFDIMSYIGERQKSEHSCVYISPTEELESSFGSSFTSDSDGRTRAFFKVQDGCDYSCTYCTIPMARGGSRSLEPGKVVEEFKQIVDSGYKEIVLTGVNVGDYGKSMDIKLYGVLLRMLEVEGEYRLRISSIEPNLLTDEIIELTAANNKMCNHFHIPLQSGSPKILKLMQRRYKRDLFENLVYKLNEKIENVGIGVDVIVGFPGETEEDFLETYNFLRDLPISYLHVFTYSERPNTKAIELDGKIDINERRRRNNMLRVLSDKKKNEFYSRMVGKEVNVLFENNNSNGFVKGFSSNYIRIQHSFEEGLANNFGSVIIKEVDGQICTVEKVINQKPSK